MLLNKNLNAKSLRTKPGDVMLGLLSLHGVSRSAQAMAIVSAVHDDGPKEIMILTNEDKNDDIFTQGIRSFVGLLEEDYFKNKFFVLKVTPGYVIEDSIPAIIENPITDDGTYLAFWGAEIPHSHRKPSWPFYIKDKTGLEDIGMFTVVDVIAEDGMGEMINRIKRDGKKT